MKGVGGECSDEGHKREEEKKNRNIRVAAGMRKPGGMSKRSCELEREKLCDPVL